MVGTRGPDKMANWTRGGDGTPVVSSHWWAPLYMPDTGLTVEVVLPVGGEELKVDLNLMVAVVMWDGNMEIWKWE